MLPIIIYYLKDFPVYKLKYPMPFRALLCFLFVSILFHIKDKEINNYGKREG